MKFSLAFVNAAALCAGVTMATPTPTADLAAKFSGFLQANMDACGVESPGAAASCAAAYSDAFTEMDNVAACMQPAMEEVGKLLDGGAANLESMELPEVPEELLASMLQMLSDPDMQTALYNLIANDIIPNMLDLLKCFGLDVYAELGDSAAVVSTYLSGSALTREQFDQLFVLLDSLTNSNRRRLTNSVQEVVNRALRVVRERAQQPRMLDDDAGCPVSFVTNATSDSQMLAGYAIAFPIDGITQMLTNGDPETTQEAECVCEAFDYVPVDGQVYVDQYLVEFMADNKQNIIDMVNSLMTVFGTGVDYMVQNGMVEPLCDLMEGTDGSNDLSKALENAGKCMALPMDNVGAMVDNVALSGLDDACTDAAFCEPSVFPLLSEDIYGKANLDAITGAWDYSEATQQAAKFQTLANTCKTLKDAGSASRTSQSAVAGMLALFAAGRAF